MTESCCTPLERTGCEYAVAGNKHCGQTIFTARMRLAKSAAAICFVVAWTKASRI
jgi:hypothetical protein